MAQARWIGNGVRGWAALLTALAVLVGVVASVPGGLTMPDEAQAQDRVLGGQLYSTGEASEVTILGGTAGIVSTLWLVSPEEIRIGTNREVGKVAQIGPYPSGEELIFAIRYNNVEFQTGPGERNPDGIVHNAVVYGEEFTTVGFEDLVGGGDRDYDDNNWKFTNVAPELPALSIDSGPDQVVPEGSTVTLEATTSMPVDELQWSLVSSSGSPIVKGRRGGVVDE